jgi:hypothetical protein
MSKNELSADLAQRVLRGLLELLLQEPSGSLDGAPFAKVSTEATGRRFVIKGWLDILHGPAIRFSAPWGDLANGQAMYQPEPQAEWDDTEEHGIDLSHSWQGIELTFDFARLPDGPVQRAKFRASAPRPRVAG